MSVTYKKLAPTGDEPLFVSIALTGGSGTGKTHSAMLLADGLAGGGKFAVLDTENKRALHFREFFPNMLHFNFGPEDHGFLPERWIDALDQLAQLDVKAVVIDSYSHSWEGIGGVLELQAQEASRRSGNNADQLAWAAIKPRYRRLTEKIVQAPFHVILCHRGKQVIQDKGQNVRPTKLRRKDIPWDIAGDKELVFEMTASLLLVPEKPGEPVLIKCPDHFRGVFNGSSRITRDAGGALAKWAETGGIGRAAKQLLDDADAAARKGKAALNEFWENLDRPQRAIVKTKLDGLRQIAIDAEQGSDGSLFPEDEPKDNKPEMPEVEEALAVRLDRALQSCLDDAMVDDVVARFADELAAAKADKTLSLELESMVATRRDTL